LINNAETSGTSRYLTLFMSGQNRSLYACLWAVTPPALSILGGFGYCLLIQYPYRVNYTQNTNFNIIAVLTLAALSAGTVCGVLSLRWRPQASHWLRDVGWLCMPGILLLVTLSDPRLMVKSVLIPRDACLNNTRRIEAAKVDWARRTGATNGAEVTWADLVSYFPSGFPKCPEAGTYNLGRVDEEVTCSNPKHRVRP
jgi:hypothetical protein